MPKVTDGVQRYHAQLANGNFTIPPAPGTARVTNEATAVAALTRYWSTRAEAAQLEVDAMMWAGAFISPGHSAIRAFLQKLFAVINLPGCLYNTSTSSSAYEWHDFADTPIPTASILGHGGRVIIQLPVRTAYDDAGHHFFSWLTADVQVAGLLMTRSAATHSLADRSASARTIGARRLRLTENRGMATGLRGAIKNAVGDANHYGVNIALGGTGNAHPLTGVPITANGGNGHVYIYFNAKAVGQCGGMMIGCENSAPGATSQTFIKHDWRARSEPFSPCLTQKWPKMLAGPAPAKEAMLVDLSDGWEHLRGPAAHVDATILDHTTLPVSAYPVTQDWDRMMIYQLTDLMASPAPRIVQAREVWSRHLAALLARRGVTRAMVFDIAQACAAPTGMAIQPGRDGRSYQITRQPRVALTPTANRMLEICRQVLPTAL